MPNSFNLLDWWPIVVAFTSIVVWLIRMESKIASNTKETERLWKTRAEDQELSRESRAEQNALLREIREDIKKIMRKEH